jgi:hypothetical protein
MLVDSVSTTRFSSVTQSPVSRSVVSEMHGLLIFSVSEIEHAHSISSSEVDSKLGYPFVLLCSSMHGWGHELMPLDILVLFQLLVYETLVERREDTNYELVDV